MNIAIQMEIKVRELEGRSLLALVAAERGHRVLLGNVRRYFTARPQDFAPGVVHDKSLTPAPEKVQFFSEIVARGSTLTSQDEEHWLNLPTFDVPAVRRFSAETLALASRSFAWGAHERDALHVQYPDQRSTVIATGSPRADLWRPEFRDYHTEEPLPGIPPERPFVLVSSNFSFVLDVNPFWVRIRDKRRLFDGLDDRYEFDRYEAAAEKQLVLRDFVRAVRHLATKHDGLTVVVRPHPIEAEGAWQDLIGPVPNVLVSRERTLSAWIRRASAVIQNGCTSGYEAAVSGVPLISFHPRGILADYPVNGLGLRAGSLDELDMQLDHILQTPEGWTTRREDGAEELLRHRIALHDSVLAADLIVDEWERCGEIGARPTDVDRILRGARIMRARAKAGAAKQRLATALSGAGGAGRRDVEPRAFRIDHKFPPLARAEVDRVSQGLRATLGRFDRVAVHLLAPDLVLFDRR